MNIIRDARSLLKGENAEEEICPYAVSSGCAVKSRMTVIGFTDGALLIFPLRAIIVIFLFCGIVIVGVWPAFFIPFSHFPLLSF